jgi:hypothetical protein
VLDAQGRIDMAATTRRRAVAYLPTAD